MDSVVWKYAVLTVEFLEDVTGNLENAWMVVKQGGRNLLVKQVTLFMQSICEGLSDVSLQVQLIFNLLMWMSNDKCAVYVIYNLHIKNMLTIYRVLWWYLWSRLCRDLWKVPERRTMPPCNWNLHTWLWSGIQWTLLHRK